MKKFIYTDDDLLKFLLGQIKFIDVDAEESDTDKVVSATIIYKNGGETDCRLPRNLIDYLSDRIHDLFEKDERITDDKDSFLCFDKPISALSDKCSDAELKEDQFMKKCKEYTDTELLEKLLTKLNYSTITSELKDEVDFIINESFYKGVEKEFVGALQKKINELRKKATDCSDANDNEDVNDDECQDACADSMCCDYAERTYSSKEYYELKKECVEKDHEIWKLKRTVEALEYLIYNCIPKDDRRKSYN